MILLQHVWVVTKSFNNKGSESEVEVGKGEDVGVGQSKQVGKLCRDSSRKWGGKGAREGVWREGICVRTCV